LLGKLSQDDRHSVYVACWFELPDQKSYDSCAQEQIDLLQRDPQYPRLLPADLVTAKNICGPIEDDHILNSCLKKRLSQVQSDRYDALLKVRAEAAAASAPAEQITLRNGFEITCHHHSLVNNRMRLYTSPSDGIYIEVAPGDIASVENVPDPPAPPAETQTSVPPSPVNPSPMDRLETALAQTGLSESDQATAKAHCAIDKTEDLEMYRYCLKIEVDYLQSTAQLKQIFAQIFADNQAQLDKLSTDTETRKKAEWDSILRMAASAGTSPVPVSAPSPVCSETGSCYGDISPRTGLPRTIFVPGYFRRDGTYVGSYYRSH
jgi:hypothetical protein